MSLLNKVLTVDVEIGIFIIDDVRTDSPEAHSEADS